MPRNYGIAEKIWQVMLGNRNTNCQNLPRDSQGLCCPLVGVGLHGEKLAHARMVGHSQAQTTPSRGFAFSVPEISLQMDLLSGMPATLASSRSSGQKNIPNS